MLCTLIANRHVSVGEVSQGGSPISHTEQITKLDAATRQLRTAMHLFFAEGDPVSIHTLTAASHEVLRALVRAKGHGSLLKDNDLIRPERAKEYRAIVNAPQNFFKHADRDLNATLDFTPEVTTVFMWDCAAMYMTLTGRQFRELFVFCAWFTLNYSYLLEPGQLEIVQKTFQNVFTTGTPSKAQFLGLIEHPEKWPLPEQLNGGEGASEGKTP